MTARYPLAPTSPSDLVASGHCVDVSEAAADLTLPSDSYRRGFLRVRGLAVLMTRSAAARSVDGDLQAILREALRITESWGCSSGLGGHAGEGNTYRRQDLARVEQVPAGLRLWALPTSEGGRFFVIHTTDEVRCSWVPADCRYRDEMQPEAACDE